MTRLALTGTAIPRSRVAPPALPRHDAASRVPCRRPSGLAYCDAQRGPAGQLEGVDLNEYCVGYSVGSLAKPSINRKLAIALTRLTPAGLTMREIPIGDLPLYSYDYDD